MKLRDLRRRALGRARSLPRRARRRVGARALVREPLEVCSEAGYRIAAELIRPAEGGRWPTVAICPGSHHDRSVFEGWTQPINAAELASAGYAVAVFDPAGRGESWGAEDYGGPEHQDDLRALLRVVGDHPAVDLAKVGVLAISLGLATACGALARYGEELPARWLLDWEGPSDREIITAGGAMMAPAMGHGLDDEFYWRPREPVRHVGQLRCPYIRVQSERDHAQPDERRHALRMVRAAERGSLPWFRLNEHPPGVVPERPEWYPPGTNSANRVLMDWIRRLST